MTVAVHCAQSAQEKIAVMAKTGRPRDSGVWKYFKYDEGTKMSICLVSTEEKNCGKQISGKFPTNLKGHLKKEHPQEFKVLEDEVRKEREVKKKTAEACSSGTSHQRQLSVAESFCAKKSMTPSLQDMKS